MDKTWAFLLRVPLVMILESSNLLSWSIYCSGGDDEMGQSQAKFQP